jgi:hypothetical protein
MRSIFDTVIIHQRVYPITPKVLEAIFQAFMKFVQAIMDAMSIQKISNFGEHVV